MPINASDGLGAYEILAPIGAGVMRDARTRETKRDREVVDEESMSSICLTLFVALMKQSPRPLFCVTLVLWAAIILLDEALGG